MTDLENSETNEVLGSLADGVMTSGEEVLYDLLFEGQNEIDAMSLAYLRELNSYHVDRLQVESKKLLDSKLNIQEEIKTLAFSNYKTFIRTAQCSKEIYGDFSIIDSKLDALIDKLPEFSSSCENFTKNIQNLNAARRANNLTLHKHNQLLEILEISQLMDTCVRNEYYEEALDLAAYVKRMDKKFSAMIPLVRRIVNDVNGSLNLMLRQLLQQLRTSLPFPQCLKTIGLIRRLDVYSESELRIKFLQLRDAWLQSLLHAIPRADPYHHISKTIEENRVHLFDIITQYRAIFAEDESLMYNASPTSGSTSVAGQMGGGLMGSKEMNESKLFNYWLQQKIDDFVDVLRMDLKAGVGSRLDSVLSQCMYFGLAFSRIGLDFRAILVPIFEEAALVQVSHALEQANAKFEESLVKVNWSDMYMECAKLTTAAETVEMLAQDLKSSRGIINPPGALIDYYPLAVYVNGVLQCLNELRLCAPLSIFSKVIQLVQNSLIAMCSHLSEYVKREKTTFDTNELDVMRNHFVYNLAYELIPFIDRCLCTLFSIEQLQTQLALTQNDEVDKLKRSMTLDRALILKPISDMVPPERVKQRPTTNEIEIRTESFGKVDENEQVMDNQVSVDQQDSNRQSEEDKNESHQTESEANQIELEKDQMENQ